MVTAVGVLVYSLTLILTSSRTPGQETQEPAGKHSAEVRVGVDEPLNTSSPRYRGIHVSTARDNASAEFVGTLTAAGGPVVHVDDSSGNLGIVDVSSGAVTVIGNMGVVLTDIAFAPNGDLYGLSSVDFYRINPATAAVIRVGSHGIPNGNALVFDTNGTLYAAGFGTTLLYTINLATGIAGAVGNTGFRSAGDLAFNAGELYMSSTDDRLIRIDLANAATGTAVGRFGFSSVFGLATGDNGVLYGISGTRVFSVDINNGSGTLVADYGGLGLGPANGSSFITEAIPPQCGSDTDCDDNNPCTDDTCENPGTANATCIHANNTAQCDDSNLCTQTDVCNGSGTCRGVTLAPSGTTCSDGNPCTENDTCDGVTSVCQSGAPAPSGTACSDGNPCTENDSCDGVTSVCQSGAPAQGPPAATGTSAPKTTRAMGLHQSVNRVRRSSARRPTSAMTLAPATPRMGPARTRRPQTGRAVTMATPVPRPTHVRQGSVLAPIKRCARRRISVTWPGSVT